MFTVLYYYGSLYYYDVVVVMDSVVISSRSLTTLYAFQVPTQS